MEAEKMKVEFMVGDSTILRDLLSAIYLVSDEVSLKAEDDGLKLFSMDYSKVAAIDVKISSGFFEEFMVEEKGETCFGIGDLVRCLRNVKRGYSARMSLSDDEISLNLISVNNEIDRRFEIHPYKSDIKTLNLPDFKHKATVELPTSLLREAVQDLLKISDVAKMSADNSEFLIEAKNEVSAGKIRFTPFGNSIIINVEDPPTQSHYSLEWLDKLSKALARISDGLMIRFSNNKPVELVTYYGCLDVRAILAPILR